MLLNEIYIKVLIYTSRLIFPKYLKSILFLHNFVSAITKLFINVIKQ